jgi:hypothetical protein
MGNVELYALKAQYEKELVMAQAKVAVIDDVIAMFQPEVEAQTEIDEVDAVEQNVFTDETY